jgi:hypothetical protein
MAVRIAPRLAALAACLVLALACSSNGDHGGRSRSGSGGAHSGDTTTTGDKGGKGGTGGSRSVGQFSREFAQCMRANGVPNFPDPNGKGGQLGPDSGIDPGAAAYLSALNGPCRSLAPPEWVADGPGSAPSGSPR